MQVNTYSWTFLILATVIALTVASRLQALYKPPVENAVTKADGGCLLEDDCLYRQARKLKLINHVENQRLEIVPIDALDLEQKNEKVKTLKRLHFSEPGRVIKREVQSWNNSRLVAAVRHKIDLPTAPEAQPWEAYQLRRSGGAQRGLRFRVRTQTEVPEAFGYVHNGQLHAGFKEWDAVAGSANPVLFKQNVRLGEETAVEIQFIGRLQQAIVQMEGSPPQPVDAYAIEWVCDPRYISLQDPDCVDKKVRAGQIRLKLTAPAYPSRATIELQLSSVPNDVPQVDGLRIKLDDNNQFVWRPLAPKAAAKKSTYQFYTAAPEKLPLLRADSRVNACAESLGLPPLLGVDRGFSFSLNGLFAEAHLPQDDFAVELSIDAILQKNAFDVLTEAMRRDPGADAKTWYANLQSTLKKEDDLHRRAALIVLNADSGDILATAGWPVTPPLEELSEWDLRAYHKVYEKHGHISPLEIQAWQILNRDNTPGSIFKPVVAAAAASSVGEDESFLKEFLGGIDAQRWNEKMAWWDRQEGRLPPGFIGHPRYTDGEYAPVPGKQAIENFKHEPMSRYFRDNRMGLKEAIQFSSNLWFIKLSMIVDRMNAYAFDMKLIEWRKTHHNASHQEKKLFVEQTLTEHPLILRRTMQMFGFDKRLPLFDWKKFNHIGWPDADFVDTALSAPPSGANIFNVDVLAQERMEWPLAQTSIGQAGVQITPLHIATIVASIANNKNIQPNLFKQLGDEKVPSRDAPPLHIRPDVLQFVHAGMKAVPEAGTAAGAFFWAKHPDTALLSGKTGTAEVKVQEGKEVLQQTKTVWFVGWRMPKPATEGQRADPRKLAFACMVTHADGTGGGTCAPIVAEFLRRINNSEQPALSACVSTYAP